MSEWLRRDQFLESSPFRRKHDRESKQCDPVRVMSANSPLGCSAKSDAHGFAAPTFVFADLVGLHDNPLVRSSLESATTNRSCAILSARA